ncbi:class F sortase [Streptomyces sp. NPDC086081]|uniref:class F sortase n=1 Tax=Streptomyces sp. NPDC086081 TaxID=3365749 RepID=UPI0037F34242
MRRPWRRRRAYRLARTIVLAVSLLVGCLCWDRGEAPSDTVTALPQGAAGAAATSPSGTPAEPAADQDGGTTSSTGTGPRTGTGTGLNTPTSMGTGTGTGLSAPTPTPTPTRPASPPKPAPRTPPPPKPAPPKSAPVRPASRPPGPSPRRPGVAPVGGERTARAEPGARPAPRKPSVRPVAEPPPRRHPALRPLPPSRATRLLIPYLRLDAPVMQLGLDREHRLTAPPEDDPKLVGWYQQGASPGEQGTAVAVGHLDTDSGPAVFAGLTELKRGRIVKARRADGRTAVYTVYRIRSYEKSDFPSQEVYGARGRPELRLITCGGTYDRRKGYSGNVVVFARLTGIR